MLNSKSRDFFLEIYQVYELKKLEIRKSRDLATSATLQHICQ
jgi:hypothetical protein